MLLGSLLVDPLSYLVKICWTSKTLDFGCCDIEKSAVTNNTPILFTMGNPEREEEGQPRQIARVLLMVLMQVNGSAQSCEEHL